MILNIKIVIPCNTGNQMNITDEHVTNFVTLQGVLQMSKYEKHCIENFLFHNYSLKIEEDATGSTQLRNYTNICLLLIKLV